MWWNNTYAVTKHKIILKKQKQKNKKQKNYWAILTAQKEVKRCCRKSADVDPYFRVTITTTITTHFIHPSGKLKLSFDRTTKNISQ